MARASKTGGKKTKSRTASKIKAKARDAATARGRKAAANTAVKPAQNAHRLPRRAKAAGKRSIADVEAALAARTAELQAALKHQAASTDVLQVINASAGDPAPVFDAILDKAMQLCGAKSGGMWVIEGDMARSGVTQNVSGPYRDFITRQRIPHAEAFGRIQDRPYLHVPDMAATEAYRRRVPVTVASVELAGMRSYLAVPLRDGNTLIGVLSLYRDEVLPFDDRQIALVRGFAAQAEIAMKNARLFNETQEALERQTATADVLKLISRSVFDLDSVMNTLARSATELCKVDFGALYVGEGDFLVARGIALANPEQVDFLRRTPLRNDSSTYLGRILAACKIGNIADVRDQTEAGRLQSFADALNFQSILFVPLVRDGRGIGVFALARAQTGEFPQRAVELVQTFADQAVIALENSRLFNETQEALARQTATADILRVISQSPTDVQPVFEAIALTAVRLLGCDIGFILLTDGSTFSAVAGADRNGPVTTFAPGNQPVDPAANFPSRAIVQKAIYHVPDWSQIEVPPYERAVHDLLKMNCAIYVPMLRGGDCVGAFALGGSRPNMFGETEIALIESFRDQAVIAVENTRLFNETQEALERQTATAEILEVIASSPSDEHPVFEAIVASANRLMAGFSSAVYRFTGGMAHLAAFTPTSPAADEVLRKTFPRTIDALPQHERIVRCEVVHFADTESLAETELVRDIARARGFRSMLAVPLIHKGEAIGVISVTCREPGAFADKHVELLQTFARQAVIAIENARLFNEVQARTRELAQSLDDLRAAQDRLVQTEKLASLGQLTAGIAHEIKNPLNFVNNFAALSAELTGELQDALKPAALDASIRGEVDEITGLLRDNLGKVVQHGKRADSIVKNMLLHSREGSGDHRPTDINALVDESLNLAYHGARAEKPQFNVTLKRNFDPEAGTVEVFPQEITRVFLNLISNSFYAVAKRGDAHDAGFEPTLSAGTRDCGQHVEIRIRDNGTGIPPEVKEKMFNPFFTTKPAGEGTGLGLSMSHDIIVKQHGGTIDVDTRPGEFTEFTIRLPRQSRFRPEG